jgi:hypothetical protein
MKKIIIEQSDTELYTSHSGLGLVGLLLNDHRACCKTSRIIIALNSELW